MVQKLANGDGLGVGQRVELWAIPEMGRQPIIAGQTRLAFQV